MISNFYVLAFSIPHHINVPYTYIRYTLSQCQHSEDCANCEAPAPNQIIRMMPDESSYFRNSTKPNTSNALGFFVIIMALNSLCQPLVLHAYLCHGATSLGGLLGCGLCRHQVMLQVCHALMLRQRLELRIKLSYLQHHYHLSRFAILREFKSIQQDLLIRVNQIVFLAHLH